MTFATGLLPYSTQMSLSPGRDTTATFQYHNTFPSSDLPTSEPDFDEFPTPRPLNRNLKRDFAAYSDVAASSDLDEEASINQTSADLSIFHKKRFRETKPPKFNPASHQLDVARRVINRAVEDSKTSVDLSDMNLTALPEDIVDLNHIVSASQSSSFSINLELYLTNNRLTALPESLFSITNLAFLGLSGNRLESLSPSVSKLANLISLNVGLNQIDFFPANLLKLHRLEHLVFHSERIHPTTPQAQRSSQTSDRSSQTIAHLQTPPKTTILTRSTHRSSRVPSLYELSMRIVASHDYWAELTDEYLEMSDIPLQVVQALRRPSTCDECGVVVCNVYATREEIWSGFARTEGLPIRRNLCSLNCLELAPQYQPF